MPQPQLSPQERRLSTFCRIFAVVYAVGALGFGLLPRLTFRLITLDSAPLGWTPQAMFWNVLAVSMMATIAVACAVVAPHPRERRHALAPVVASKLTSSVFAAAHLIRFHGAPGARALVAILLTDFPLFLLTLWVYRSAAPGVHTGANAAAAADEPPKVQLGISKPT